MRRTSIRALRCRPGWRRHRDGVWVARVCGYVDTVPEGKKRVESLNEVRIAVKQPGDSLNNPWGVDAMGGQLLDVFVIRQRQQLLTLGF